jgi:hypothetical protein
MSPTTWILSAQLATASLLTPTIPAPETPADTPRQAATTSDRPDPTLAMALGLGAGLVAIAPPFLGANAVVSVGTAAASSLLPYAYLRDPWRSVGAPLASLGSGLLGAVLGSRVALPLVSGRSPSLGSDAGTDWTEGGFLVGLALFGAFSAWDAWRLARASATVPQPELDVK